MFNAVKLYVLSKFLSGFVKVLSLSSQTALISCLNITERPTTRYHSKRAKTSIREMWNNSHTGQRQPLRVTV